MMYVQMERQLLLRHMMGGVQASKRCGGFLSLATDKSRVGSYGLQNTCGILPTNEAFVMPPVVPGLRAYLPAGPALERAKLVGWAASPSGHVLYPTKGAPRRGPSGRCPGRLFGGPWVEARLACSRVLAVSA